MSITIRIPVDLSAVGKREDHQDVKAVALSGGKAVGSAVVKFDEKGHGVASLRLEDGASADQIALVPVAVADVDAAGADTVRAVIPRASGREVKLAPIVVSPFYWRQWWTWCRTFVVQGRLVCADGSPVPGATVTALDVDRFWWWTSTSTFGTATTAADGTFTMQVRWCCGWRFDWWWSHRLWRIDADLLAKLRPVLAEDPTIGPIPEPGPVPDLRYFDKLLRSPKIAALLPNPEIVNPAKVSRLGAALLERGLLIRPELERIRPWPWYPWTPWQDCNPDLIFRATQLCGNKVTVILDEPVTNVRWDVPTNLTVTLTASADACCLPLHEPDPASDCIVLTTVCDALITTIGGNAGAPATPAGYAEVQPGSPGDRPFAGTIWLGGLFGASAQADYYELEWSSEGLLWSPMPDGAMAGFARTFWGPPIGGTTPVTMHGVGFTPVPIDGHLVYESRLHFEASNDASSWDVTRYWAQNRDLLAGWIADPSLFPDGLYFLRVKSWTLSGGHLTNPRILPLCDTEITNHLAIRVDNRASVASTGAQPCGPGTVHTCTVEPDSAILGVYINGVKVDPCGVLPVGPTDQLDIDFVAHDAEGHLHGYTLDARWGAGFVHSLLTLPGASVTPHLAPGFPPPAAQVGPDYASALGAGATRPTWAGGTMRLTVPRAKDAFPDVCAYLLDLRVYKRTIVNCYHGYDGHANVSQVSFTATT